MQNFAGTRLTTCAMQHKEGKVPAVCVGPKQEWIQYKWLCQYIVPCRDNMVAKLLTSSLRSKEHIRVKRVLEVQFSEIVFLACFTILLCKEHPF